MAEREIERWVTIRGHRVPIYKGETEEDVHNRFLDAVGEKHSKSGYASYENNTKMCEAFMEDTNVLVGPGVESTIPKEVLADVFDTIRAVKEKYGAKINQIVLPLKESESVMASMSYNGALMLNPRYFSDKEYLDEAYKGCVEKNFHPSAPNGAIGAVSHELGHAIFNARIEKMGKEYNATYNEIVGNTQFLSNKISWPGYDSDSAGYKLSMELYDKAEATAQKIQNDKQIKSMYGTFTSPTLSELANTDKMGKFGVSKYAGKNTHEAVAEAFCDVYCNGGSASVVSKYIYDAYCK